MYNQGLLLILPLYCDETHFVALKDTPPPETSLPEIT